MGVVVPGYHRQPSSIWHCSKVVKYTLINGSMENEDPENEDQRPKIPKNEK